MGVKPHLFFIPLENQKGNKAMIIYTAQMAMWRLAKKLNYEFIDTTVKSGDPVFAPNWDLVKRWKAGEIDWETYKVEYVNLLRESWYRHPEEWRKMMEKDEIVIACYCSGVDETHHCHRFILADVLKAVGDKRSIPVTLMGELKK